MLSKPFMVSILAFFIVFTVKAQLLDLPQNISIEKLDNGFTYYLVPFGEPGKVKLTLFSKTGNLVESPDLRGYTHFLEHMCFKGSKNYPGDMCVETLESMGLRIGSEYNAFVNDNKTQFYLTIPENNNKYLYTTLNVMKDWVYDLEFDVAALEIEKKVVAEEIKRGQGSFSAYLMGTDQEDNNGLGTVEQVHAIDRDKLVDFYKKYYTTNSMALIITGDVNPEIAKDYVTKTFGSLPAEKAPLENRYEDLTKSSVVIDYYQEINQKHPAFVIASKLKQQREDTYDGFKAYLIRVLLCDILQNRLKNSALATFKSTDVILSNIIPGTTMYNVRLVAAEDVPFQDRVNAYNDVLSTLAAFGVGNEELAHFKSIILERYESAAEDHEVAPSNVINYFLTQDALLTGAMRYKLVNKIFTEISISDFKPYIDELFKLNKSIIYDGKNKANTPEINKNTILRTLSRVEKKQENDFVFEAPVNAMRLIHAVPVDTIQIQGDFPKAVNYVNKKPLGKNLYLLEYANGYKVVVFNSSRVKNTIVKLNGVGLNGIPEEDRYNFEKLTAVLSPGVVGYNYKEWYKLQRAKRIFTKWKISDFEFNYQVNSTLGNFEAMLQTFNLETTQALDLDLDYTWSKYSRMAKRKDTTSTISQKEILFSGIQGLYLPKDIGGEITKAEIARLNAYKTQLFANTKNAAIYVGGNLPENIDALISKYIGGIKASESPVTLFPMAAVHEANGIEKFTYEWKNTLAHVSFLFSEQPSKQVGMKDRLLLKGISQYGFTREFEILRRKYGLIYALGTDGYSRLNPNKLEFLSLRYMLDEKQVDRSLEVVKSEIIKPMSEAKLSKSELVRFKAMVGSYYLVYYYDEQRLQNDFLQWILEYKKAYSYNELQELIEDLSAKDIKSKMKSVVDDSNFIIWVKNPEKS